MNIAFHIPEWLLGILGFIAVIYIGVLVWILLLAKALSPKPPKK